VCVCVCVCIQEQDEFVIQMLNGIGDFVDLRNVLNPQLRPNFRHMSVQQVKEYVAGNGHCSALVKVVAHFALYTSSSYISAAVVL